jgi:hypothetical protein
MLTPTSPMALRLFDLGLKLYHVFWFDLSVYAFRYSRAYDRSFFMSYYGEAMALKQPIWHTEDVVKAHALLSQIPPNAKLNQVESLLVDAARTYFDPSKSVTAREQDYSDKMKRLYEKYPNNADIGSLRSNLGALFSLSLLGLSISSPKYGETAKSVNSQLLAKFPNHRGLLHYQTHAFVMMPKFRIRPRTLSKHSISQSG